MQTISWDQFYKAYQKREGSLWEDSRSIPGFTKAYWFTEPVEKIQIFNNPSPKDTTLQLYTALRKLDEAWKRGDWILFCLYYESGFYFLNIPEIRFLPTQLPLLSAQIFRKVDEVFYKSPPSNITNIKNTIEFTTEIDKEKYQKNFALVQDALKNGESYELNLTFPIQGKFVGDPFLYYQSLKAKQKTEYSAYFSFGAERYLSISPELFLSVEGNRVVAEPMKGTSPRGISQIDDENKRIQLLESEKERAENVMITDLYRNDLGRFAKQGTVQVVDLFKAKALPTVWQMVSKIECEWKETFSLYKHLPYLFPSGSVTGAPKHRSVSLLWNIEKKPRGLYTGGLFLCGHRPSEGPFLISNVAIRTMTVSKNSPGWSLSYGVGSGVTVLSQAEEEYQECLSKLRVLQEDTTDNFELLETIRLSQGRYTLLDWHLNRMETSAKRLGFPYSELKAKETLASLSFITNGRLRVRLLLNESGQFRAESFALSKTNKKKKVLLCFSETPISQRSLFLSHKTTNRSFYENQLQQANAKKADDTVLCTESGEVLETCLRNLFYKKQNVWYTPDLEYAGLPGVLRAKLIAKGWVKIRKTRKEDLLEAEELIVGNSLRGFERVHLIN